MSTSVPLKYRNVMEGGNGVGATRRFEGAGADAARRYWKLWKWSEDRCK